MTRRLLVHHFSPENHNEIVVTTRWGSFSIKHNVNQLDPKEKAILLRIHSFSGCDTVSRYFGFSKEKIFKKAVVFYRTTGPWNDDFYKSIEGWYHKSRPSPRPTYICLYGDKSKSFDRLRFLSYNRMIAKKTLNPARLPPTTSAATEHILRAYLQYHNWAMLNTTSLNPCDYGWEWTSERGQEDYEDLQDSNRLTLEIF